MTKRKFRKHQKGGDWNPMTWFNTFSTQSWKDYLYNLGNKTTEGVGNLTNNIENAITDMSTFQPETTQSIQPAPIQSAPIQPAPIQPAPIQQDPTFGGKSKHRRHKRRQTMKGGKNGLGLTYYATPVSGLRVAEPTTWQHYANGTNQYSTKGGKKSRRRKQR